MSIELPADRLRRRLGADSDNTHTDPGVDAGDDAEAADAQPDTSLSRWLPEAGPTGRAAWISTIRADPGRAGVIALGALAGVAVLVTVLSVIWNRPPAVVSAKLPPVEMVASATAGPAVTEPQGPVVVSVIGLVHTPGLVTLHAGARIADALDAAGGALSGADVSGLNMARRVSDGEQIVVGIGGPPGQPVQMGSSIVSDPGSSPVGQATSESTTNTTGLVDLNTATADELDALPGVGPVTAAAILAWRAENGRFSSVDQLGEVDGIGPARLDKLRDHVRA